jgi:hypothetical protein
MNLFNGPSTKVKVGCSRIFTLPKNLLSYYFKFFEVILDGSSTEGVEESVELKDCNEQDFELVVQVCLLRILCFSLQKIVIRGRNVC